MSGGVSSFPPSFSQYSQRMREREHEREREMFTNEKEKKREKTVFDTLNKQLLENYDINKAYLLNDEVLNGASVIVHRGFTMYLYQAVEKKEEEEKREEREDEKRENERDENEKSLSLSLSRTFSRTPIATAHIPHDTFTHLKLLSHVSLSVATMLRSLAVGNSPGDFSLSQLQTYYNTLSAEDVKTVIGNMTITKEQKERNIYLVEKSLLFMKKVIK